jgi:molybdate transport system substrate-binding protein
MATTARRAGLKAGRRRGRAARCARRLGALALLAFALGARADEVQVAVAANFAAPMAQIAADFSRESGHRATIVSGSTGKLYAQIRSGAPFALLLAADQETPAKLEAEGLAVPGQRFTYAIGKLVLYSAKPGFVDGDGAVLRAGGFDHLALANPKIAPYGAAAMEVLASLHLVERLQDKLVQGESIGQTFQFISTGNAELGFVALSQVAPPDRPVAGSWWLVPAALYRPIRQDAVLLQKGADQAAARALLQYLQSDRAKAVIRAFGYGT